ncbi:MAG: hypothetical protein NC200_07450 [Candidatus Gastranaerophilales bacterium]|nr:hypothetical protein [Candidatus Gastranaerophilales bacterium]
MNKNIKTVNGIVYALFQTDVWKTKSSYVCFGIYNSFELANAEAKKNNLYTADSKVVITPIKLNQYAEVI